MTSDEIRERYLAFFEERGHRRIPSASLVPSAHDPSALLTVAGMHPLKPYFLGQEVPPAPRLTNCQKVFRTVDIDNVGNTARHLTFFEMLGNFSFGDYFKREAIEFAWELSREVFGFPAEDIWVTVFEGDDALGLGPDEEAIACWRSVGVERERIVECPRSENFWQAGPTGPCGPCSELYLDRGVSSGAAEDLPGGENERFLEYWNLVFMQYDQQGRADGGANTVLEPLPANNIDTGMGLNRMAAILQGKRSVFETDQFEPLIELGEELSGRRYGEDPAVDRALRILSDHARAMTFLVADGVVPSNEDRGYVLRRVMRRAIQQGRGLELAPGFLTRYAERVGELMGGAYPELQAHKTAIDKWLSAEEEGFGRTLVQGLATLRLHIDQARAAERSTVPAAEVFRLHDTYGFPYEMTNELLAEEGLSIEGDFERLMEEQRARGRASARGGGTDAAKARALASAFAGESGFPTRFTGYETEQQQTTVGALRSFAANGSGASTGTQAPASREERYLVKLAESPFYAAGGGQVADAGTIECEHGDCRARVQEVFRLGEDQALVVVMEEGALRAGEQVLAQVDHAARHATECNHTATHLLQAALRERLGSHVRQAGSYVGPDKLRFDFSHGQALSAEELRDVEDRVNQWIARSEPVRPITTTLPEAQRLGAMALFGEKYGEVVRMVQIGAGEYSRELCGGTHVRSTSEIGLFHIIGETSSAANVRRIEAVTGPAAVRLLREHDRMLAEVAATLRTRPEGALEAVRARELERKGLERALKEGAGGAGGRATVDMELLAARAQEIGGAHVLAAVVEVSGAKALLELADRLKGMLPDAAILLGTAAEGRVHLLASVAPALVGRGVRAGAVVKAAAEVVGGGGGGRDTMAQAGGREPQKLQAAIDTGRATIESALAS
jgi:alanyl-tRNA synthetase